MGPAFIIAMKDLRLLFRDARSAIILLLMPIALVVVLGLTLGDMFGKKADDQIRVSVLIEDEGIDNFDNKRVHPPNGKWSDVMLDDLKNTGNIQVEVIPTRAEAERLVKKGKRSSIIVFKPEFSRRVDRCSFVGPDFKKDPINPLDRYGVVTSKIDVEYIDNPYQPIGSSIVKQVTQVSLMRVIVPWMIGQAFDLIGTPLFMEKMAQYLKGIPLAETAMKAFGKEFGDAIKKGIANFFAGYNFNALTWHGLTRDDPAVKKDMNSLDYRADDPTFGRGTRRYQILVPNYTVTFAFFLVLTVGWLFVAERRHGTLVRLRAAPISRSQILIGKMIPCLVVSLIQGFVLLLCGKLIFGMSWGSQPLLLIPIVISTSLAAVGMAMFVAGLAKTETQVAVYGTLLVLILAGLSGSLMPREMMPETMKQLSLITPHAWALDAYEQLLHPDNPAIDTTVIWQSCGVLTAFGVTFGLLTWLFMRLK